MRILNLVISEFEMGLGLTGLKRTVGRRYALCLVTCQLYRVVSVNKDLRWASSACVSSSLCRINQQPFRIRSRVRGRWSQSPKCPAALWAERTTSLLLWEVIFIYLFHLYQLHNSCSCAEQLSEVQSIFTKDTSTRCIKQKPPDVKSFQF